MEVFFGGNYILLRNPTKNFTATAFLHDVLNAGNPQKTLEQSPFSKTLKQKNPTSDFR
jgi:hypothetical protein